MFSKPSDENSSDSDDECQVFEPENAPIGLSSDEMKMDVDNHEGKVCTFSYGIGIHGSCYMKNKKCGVIFLVLMRDNRIFF